MIKSRIIVTGATGKTGSVVVAELLKAGYPGRSAVILFGGVCPRKGGVKNLLCKITNVIFGEDYANRSRPNHS
jgi:nucleoside-diphosphate-sugar epimerase